MKKIVIVCAYLLLPCCHLVACGQLPTKAETDATKVANVDSAASTVFGAPVQLAYSTAGKKVYIYIEK